MKKNIQIPYIASGLFLTLILRGRGVLAAIDSTPDFSAPLPPSILERVISTTQSFLMIFLIIMIPIFLGFGLSYLFQRKDGERRKMVTSKELTSTIVITIIALIIYLMLVNLSLFYDINP